MYYLILNGTQAGPYSLEQVQSRLTKGEVNAQTLFWQEGMTDWQPLESIKHLFAEEISPRVFGGFWRRLGAYALDTLLLGVVGFGLGLFFFQYFAQMGAWALLVGFTISFFYFGLLNSAIGRGQTLGKRYLGLEVINHEGGHLAPGPAFLRYVIFALPFYLNGVLTTAGFLATSWQALLIRAIVFATGGIILYLYAFNRPTRQSLHDLAVGSYVVRTVPNGKVDSPPLWKGHLVVIAVLLLLAMGIPLVASTFIHVPFFEKLLAVQEAIISSGKVNSVTVTEGFNWYVENGNSETLHVLSINANWKGKPADSDAAAHEIAAIVLKQYPDAAKDDRLTIMITSGYNIGIYSSSSSAFYSHRPAAWEDSPASTNP